MLIEPGILVEIIDVPDQDYFTKLLVGKIGLVIENIKANSSPNIWRILFEDGKIYKLHKLDLKPIIKMETT
jgi:hypothetical protein